MKSAIVYRNHYGMGTRMDLVFPGVSEERVDDVFRLIRTELARIEEKISNYKENSIFSKLNVHAFKIPQKTDRETLLLIKKLKELSAKTQGYFDFTLGKLVEKNTAHQPAKQLEAGQPGQADVLGSDQVITDEELSAISFSSGNVSLDSGAFGKGLGLDAIKKILEAVKVDSAFISFGESSILAHGHHPYGTSWKTGVCDLYDQERSIFVFDLTDEALSVSGNTEQNRKKYGGGHIVDPLTGNPVEGFRQAAVAGQEGMVSEVLSTALMCAPNEKREEIMSEFPGYRGVVIDYDDSKKAYISLHTYNIDNERTG